MTNEEMCEAFRMRLEGSTLQECADRFGVSRERIRQITPTVPSRGRRQPNPESCVYPNIAAWMVANRCGYTRLAKLSGVSAQTVWNAMTGVCQPNKPLIDKLLAVTGMTYEEAFKT